MQVGARSVGSVLVGRRGCGRRSGRVLLWRIAVYRLAGAESLERFECCRLVREVVERPCCGLNLGQRGLASLDAEAREPAQRRALKPIGFGVPNGDAHLQGVAQVHAWQFRGGVADQGEVACLQGPSEASVCRSLTRHERMFACLSSSARHTPHGNATDGPLRDAPLRCQHARHTRQRAPGPPANLGTGLAEGCSNARTRFRRQTSSATPSSSGSTTGASLTIWTSAPLGNASPKMW